MNNSFVNLNMYPLYKVTMIKMGACTEGPTQITEYIRASGIGNVAEEAKRRHPGYLPSGRYDKIDEGIR
jgi:hypothetical protein